MIPALGKGPVHLLGVGGTAMASLAGLLTETGVEVTGSDQGVYPPMSDLLTSIGVSVRTPYHPDNVPRGCTLVVVGNAISRGNAELEAVLARRLPYVSMSEVVKELLLRERLPVVVAGTHGKTTTTSLTAWLLASAGLDPGFLVGGIPLNFDRSYRIGHGAPFVIEGDEYDTAYFDKGPKFMHYLPHVAILGNVEFDHADIYGGLDDVERVFGWLVNLVPENGLLVLGSESRSAVSVARASRAPVTTFSVTSDADWTVEVVSCGEPGTRFRVKRHGETSFECEAPLWGDASLRNMLAAVAAASQLGAEPAALAEALPRFRGVKRRLEVLGVVRGVTVVDDFAHHPTAVSETIRAARRRYPGRRLWAVFEPRSFTSRSRVFQSEMAEAFRSADVVVISEVFSSARLAQEEELSEERLVSDLRDAGVSAEFIPTPDEITRFIAERAADGDVVLVMSNGGFGGLHEKLLLALGAGTEPG